MTESSTSRAANNAFLGNYEHLKKLEPLLGAWTGEFVSPEDRPTANIKKGDTITQTATFKWHLDKSTILYHGTMGLPGADPVWQGTFFIGWDTTNQRILAFAFENTGGHQVIDDWTIQGDQVTLQGKGSDPFGNKTSFTIVMSDIQPDSFVWRIGDTVIAGKKVPDYPGVTMKRVQAK